MTPKSEETNRKEQWVANHVVAHSPHILLAEDYLTMRQLMALLLRKEGYRVTECADGMSLLDHLSFFFLPGEKQKPVDLIISDIRLPRVTGMEIVMGGREKANFPPVILITAFGSPKVHEHAKRMGVAAMFDKPFNIDHLLAKVHELVTHSP